MKIRSFSTLVSGIVATTGKFAVSNPIRLLAGIILMASSTNSRANQTVILHAQYNLVSCQVNGTGGNNVNNASFLQVPSTLSDPYGGDNAVLLVANCLNNSFATYQYFTGPDADNYFFTFGSSPGWYDANGNLANNVIWHPGRGMFIKKPTSGSATITLNGTTPTPILPPTNYCGCDKLSLLGTQTPNVSGTYENVLGISPLPGAQVLRYNGVGYDTYTNSCSGWSPSIPILTTNEAAYFFVPCNSNLCCPPQPLLLFNTGVDATGGVLANGAVDPHYGLTTNPNVGGGSNAYVVTGTGLTNTSTSEWISPLANGNSADGTFVYRMTFNVPCTNSAIINVQWAVDNSGIVQLNGNPTPVNTIATLNSSSFTTWHPFTITSGLVAGQNTLVFSVTNNGVGLTALRVELSGTANCCSCVPPPTNMVSWWTGDGYANDIQGGNHGTLVNGATFAPGKVAQAFSFDGTNDYVAIPHSSTLDLSFGHTVDLWVKVGAYPPSGLYTTLVSKWTYGAEDKSLTIDPTGKVQYYLYDSFGGIPLSSSTSLALGTWYHLAATYDGTTAKIYINGLLNANKPASGNIGDGNGKLYFGHNPDLAASGATLSPFKGLVDEIEWFNRALTTNEIAAIYSAANFGKCKPCLLVFPSGGDKTVSCGTNWSFDTPTNIIDTCCANYTLTFTDVTNSGSCPFASTRTWLVSDTCGNSNTCSQKVTVVDNTPPVLTACVTNRITAGGVTDDFAGAEPASPSAGLRARLGSSIYRGFDTGLDPNNPCPHNLTFAHTFSNLPPCITAAHLTVRLRSCGGLSQNDSLGLSFTGSNGTLVTNAGSWGRYLGTNNPSPGLTNAVWSSGMTMIVPLDLSNLTNGNGTVTNLLSDMSANGFLDVVLQDDTAIDYLILDVTSCCCNSHVTVQCDSTWGFATPTAVDDCCTNVTVSLLSAQTNGQCPKVVSWVWRAVDCCTNITTCTQTVTMVDTKPPVMTRPANIVVESYGNVAVHYSATATDNCCTNATVVFTPLSGTVFTLGKTTNVQVVATDCCSNSVSYIFTVTVQYPTIHLNGSGTFSQVDWIVDTNFGWNLQWATNLIGPWVTDPTATNPPIPVYLTNKQMYFRLISVP